MAIKQISVFVENKPGRLADITGFLADGGISIRAFSIADTTDFGILRLIVSDTDKAAKVLKEHGVAVSLIGRKPVDALTLKENITACRFKKSADYPERSRLAAA